MRGPLIEATAVERHFEGGHVTALRGASVAVDEGEFVSVMGPSGSGKSTLLHILGGLELPSAGEVLYAARACGRCAIWPAFAPAVSASCSSRSACCPRSPPSRTCRCRCSRWAGRGANGARGRKRCSRASGSAIALHHLPSKLSGGERQRVSIARSLANGPDLLLADEPTGNLDSASAHAILELVQAIDRERRMTVIVVTHDADVAGAAHRALRMKDGRIVTDSPGDAAGAPAPA